MTRALTDTGAQSILAFKSCPRYGNFMENVKVDTSELSCGSDLIVRGHLG